MTVEEILAALQAIIDEAGAAPLSEEQEARYVALEAQLERTNASINLRARNAAYNAVAPPVAVPGSTPPAAIAPERARFQNYLRGRAVQPQAAQSEGVPSEGGYLVPPEFRDKLVECLKSFGGIAAVVDEFSTDSGAPIEWPTVSDAPSGVPNVGQITPENTAFTGGADLVFGTNTLGSYKYTTAGANDQPLKIPVELLQDSSIDIEALVSRKFGERIARKQAKNWAYGTGIGEPLGILTRTAAVELATTNLISTQTDPYAWLLSVEDALDSAYLDNAKWGMNRKTWTQMRLIRDDNNRPIIQTASDAGLGTKIERTVLGYPVVIDESFPDAADDVNFLAFGDFKAGYVIRRIKDVTVLVNPYSSGASGQVEYTAWSRADGTIQDSCAYVVAKGKDAA